MWVNSLRHPVREISGLGLPVVTDAHVARFFAVSCCSVRGQRLQNGTAPNLRALYLCARTRHLGLPSFARNGHRSWRTDF